MGTSGSSSGSRSETPLVPTWLSELPTEPLPGSGDAVDPDGDENERVDPSPPEEVVVAPRPSIDPPPEPNRFRRARSNFSRFAGSGGSDIRALRRAVRDYARSGTGGSGNAVRRMGTSRTAASNALAILRGFQRDSVRETLLYLNLESLVGSSPQEVFLGLTEVVCREGGSVDEAIARDAWLDTVAEIDKLGIVDLEDLENDQIQEIFLNFIAHAIEALLYQEIGVNGFQYAESLASISGFDEQLRSYIQRAVRDSFSSDLMDLSSMSDANIREVVDRTFQETWELLELLGDRES